MFKFISVLLILNSFCFAGTTGKIVGTAVDHNTGNPLPGVNIFMLNSKMGASSDVDGQFIILNIPPGEYDIEVNMLDYKTLIQNEVKISVDLTTKLELALTGSAIRGEEVIVFGERPLVQKDITSRQAYTDGSQLTDLPTRDFKDVLALQADVSRDASGRLHFRGGRSGEVACLIDGVYMDDPLKGGFGSELIEANQLRQNMDARLGLTIGEEAIDEMVSSAELLILNTEM